MNAAVITIDKQNNDTIMMIHPIIITISNDFLIVFVIYYFQVNRSYCYYLLFSKQMKVKKFIQEKTDEHEDSGRLNLSDNSA
jgi:hypothetical protein